jgi:hypothetical protein
MKKLIYLFVSVFILIFTSSNSYSQPNTVQLTPPGGPIALFPSITAAYTIIPPGPLGNYLIELLPGYDGSDPTEAYPIQLTDKLVAPFTITLRPAAGNNGETIQRPVAAAGVVIQINGGDNVIIDGRPGGVTSTPINYLTVNDPFAGSNTNRNIELLNGADNNVIQYINSTAALAVGAAGSRNILIGATTGAGNLNNTVTNCIIIGGLRGIQDFGTIGIPNSGSIITFNDVMEFGAIGIFAGTDQNNITVENNRVHLTAFVPTGVSVFGIAFQGGGVANINQNEIFDITGSAATSIIGINSAAVAVATLNINRNKIYNLNSTAVAGSIVIRGMSMFFLTGSVTNINNNFVSITEPNTTATAIFGILMGLNGTNTYTANIYYNSVRIGGTHTGGTAGSIVSSGIFRSDNNAGSTYIMKNNIAVNDRIGGTAGVFHVGGWVGSAVGILDMDYNTYWGTGGTANNGWSAGWVTTLYDTTGIGAYRTAAAPQEQNSKFNSVAFVSNTDLHVAGASIGDTALAGINIPGITIDIDGETRHNPPYRGADENVAFPLPVELASFVSFVNKNNVQLNWTTVSEINNAGFDIERKPVVSNTWDKIGNVAGNGTTNESKNYSFSDNGLQTGSYNYRLKQIDFNGNFEYFDLTGEVIVGVPNDFKLSQNYPNPFNPTTKIDYDLPVDSKVNLRVYDMLGREVASIVNEQVNAGYYTVQLNATNFASGTYFFRLVAQGTNGKEFVMTKKMQLIK